VTLDEARGLLDRREETRRVEYRPAGARPDQGVVTAVTDRYVFVRYNGQTHAKATVPEDLHLIWEEA
jgi:hypothetical protein